ncbi:TetR/AcrR family transcriptional regulator [Chromohalobacter canadensis]|uniref:TetR/AcrR family transcriptional regulator n=1 Tax=Chromohalobacter canadensis TaxID=141389 RepID=A0ABZ0YFR6_9GAMM|nr:TetR/AcrR family transcriptional regulator [Chromohalobacter canadensis]MCK0767263.1 TetR/AcrR family transcriptional regulator [Chromohalobacter canadensis]WQH10132.1 TetR/AcrR family transcriptional regulator [Chromohalobacter canadensis]
MSDSTNRKARSRERILKSAVELFSRQGFEKVSIGQIMKLAKMTHGAFYAHFASKEALYHASVRDTLESSRAARLVKGPLSVKHLTELVSNCWNLQELERKHQPGPETVLFNEIGNENAEIRTLFEASYLRMKKMLETRLIASAASRNSPSNPTATSSPTSPASFSPPWWAPWPSPRACPASKNASTSSKPPNATSCRCSASIRTNWTACSATSASSDSTPSVKCLALYSFVGIALPVTAGYGTAKAT